MLHLRSKTKKGEKYAPGSLATAVNILMTHYNKFNKTNLNFWRNPKLAIAKEVLNTELAEMQAAEHKPKEKAIELTNSELEIILSSQWCNFSTSDGLICRLYVLISGNFGYT